MGTEERRKAYLLQAADMYAKGGMDVEHTSTCDYKKGYPSLFATCTCWPLIKPHIPTSLNHLPAGVTPLPKCPNFTDTRLHPRFDEITERDFPFYEPDHERGGFVERQHWYCFFASIVAYPVVGLDPEEGLITSEDENERDEAIDAIDHDMGYYIGNTGMEVLICGICKAEFSWERGLDKLEETRSGKWE